MKQRESIEAYKYNLLNGFIFDLNKSASNPILSDSLTINLIQPDKSHETYLKSFKNKSEKENFLSKLFLNEYSFNSDLSTSVTDNLKLNTSTKVTGYLRSISKKKTIENRLEIVRYMKLPMKSFTMPEKIELNETALRLAEKIINLEEANKFMDKFGTHLIKATYYIGGIFTQTYSICSNETNNKKIVEEKSKENFKTGLNFDFMPALKANLNIDYVNTNFQKLTNVNNKTFEVIEYEIKNLGPLEQDPNEFYTALKSNPSQWKIIERTDESLIPIWKLLETFEDEKFYNSIIYLQAALLLRVKKQILKQKFPKSNFNSYLESIFKSIQDNYCLKFEESIHDGHLIDNLSNYLDSELNISLQTHELIISNLNNDNLDFLAKETKFDRNFLEKRNSRLLVLFYDENLIKSNTEQWNLILQDFLKSFVNVPKLLVNYDFHYELSEQSIFKKTIFIEYFNKKEVFKNNIRLNFFCLNELNLSKKNLEYLDNSLFDLPNLKALDLSDNKLVSISSNCFYGLKSLLYLNLSNNKLTFIDEKLFNNLKCLKILLLDRNHFSFLSNNLFNHLKDLELLSLRSNTISFIHLNQFTKLISLRYLFLNDNSLQSFESHSLACLIYISLDKRLSTEWISKCLYDNFITVNNELILLKNNLNHMISLECLIRKYFNKFNFKISKKN